MWNVWGNADFPRIVRDMKSETARLPGCLPRKVERQLYLKLGGEKGFYISRATSRKIQQDVLIPHDLNRRTKNGAFGTRYHEFLCGLQIDPRKDLQTHMVAQNPQNFDRGWICPAVRTLLAMRL